jgi:hypothetical protein
VKFPVQNILFFILIEFRFSRQIFCIKSAVSNFTRRADTCLQMGGHGEATRHPADTPDKLRDVRMNGRGLFKKICQNFIELLD